MCVLYIFSCFSFFVHVRLSLRCLAIFTSKKRLLSCLMAPLFCLLFARLKDYKRHTSVKRRFVRSVSSLYRAYTLHMASIKFCRYEMMNVWWVKGQCKCVPLITFMVAEKGEGEVMNTNARRLRGRGWAATFGGGAQPRRKLCMLCSQAWKGG